MAVNGNGSILATGSSDASIQLWDTERDILITTMKSHKGDVNGLKFGLNSNDKLCSVSSDRTIKMWDALERTYIDTFYGHREEGLDIDCLNANDFITSGKDQQVIVWKTEKQTQTVFSGHDYAIDRVRVVNTENFLTASQDGGVFLWTSRKKKPIFKVQHAHTGSWISALAVLSNTDLFATGAGDHQLNIYQIAEDIKSFKVIARLPTEGIVTDLKLHGNTLFTVSSD
jgi:ribosomal RNA-processing protein 9